MIIDTSQPGRCKACQRIIYWRVEPKSGRSNPYNPPEPCGPCNGEGKIAIHQLEGVTYVDCKKCDGRGRIQISHFATCIAAKAFRSKR